MAWTSPRTWVAAETVTAAIMNTHIRDNLLYIAGSSGFLATPSAAYGIQPSAGYFIGSVLSSTHVEFGSTTLSGGNRNITFARQFASTAPAVVASVTTGWGNNAAVIISSVSSAGFTASLSGGTTQAISWIAMGVTV